MGFFDLKADCAICYKKTGLNRFRIANKEWVCPKCFKKAGLSLSTPIQEMTSFQIKNIIQEKEQSTEALSSFIATKKIGSYLEVDENSKTWLIPDGFFGGKKNPMIYSFNDILGFELLENGSSITKGGLGRALVGGALFSGVGAVVGATTGKKKNKSICDSLKIKITLKSMANPVVYINFITNPTKMSSLIYKSSYSSAQECLSVLQLICDTFSKEEPPLNNENISSVADEILKFKQLLDSDIITEEEFEEKKKQLLGL